MKINYQTLMFEELSSEEARELEDTARAILNGPPPNPYPKWLNEWCLAATGGRDIYGLLVLATVFPARALLSVIDWQKNQNSFGKVEEIVMDLTSRSGFDAVWDQLESNIRKEIVTAIYDILRR